MHTIPYLQERIKEVFQSLVLPVYPKALYDPIHYSLGMGGKRVRPMLTLLACNLFDEDINPAIQPAIGIEIFHNFTLVHDDIMDNAPLRRGKPTVYRKWDTNTAILSGDTMFALGYEHVAKVNPKLLPAILEVFTQTAREVCEGQQLDMDFESAPEVHLDAYLEMIRLKTAVLLGCCLKVGSLAGGAGLTDANLLYKVGENLGMAFQIQDDLLDTFGDESTFGKKTGGDILSRKKTFLFLKGLQLANAVVGKQLSDIYNDLDMDPEEKILQVKGIFTTLQIHEASIKTIDQYYNKAMAALEKVALPEPKKAFLKKYCAELMNRTF